MILRVLLYLIDEESTNIGYLMGHENIYSMIDLKKLSYLIKE